MHEWVQKLTAIVVLLWVLSWGLHTKALSHDPAPEGPLPVLHPEICALPWTDQQLHLPSSFFNKVPWSPLSQVFSSLPSSCLPFLYAFQFSPSPVPPFRNLLKTFPPSRSWTPSPSRSLTLPPWLIAQVSIHWKMPTIPGSKTSYVFNLICVLRYAVQSVHPIMYVQHNVCYVVPWVSREQRLAWS